MGDNLPCADLLQVLRLCVHVSMKYQSSRAHFPTHIDLPLANSQLDQEPEPIDLDPHATVTRIKSHAFHHQERYDQQRTSMREAHTPVMRMGRCDATLNQEILVAALTEEFSGNLQSGNFGTASSFAQVLNIRGLPFLTLMLILY